MTDLTSFAESLKSEKCEILINSPMSRHTSFRVGGNADIVAIPEDIDALWKFHRIIKVKSAIVTANSVTGMADENDKTSDKKYAKLNGETVLVGESGIADYLGYSVEAYVYYDEDEDYGEVKYAELSDKNITVTVKPVGAPSFVISSEKLYWVFATHTGHFVNPKSSNCLICASAFDVKFTPSPP